MPQKDCFSNDDVDDLKFFFQLHSLYNDEVEYFYWFL
jgi:hypothetical protein